MILQNKNAVIYGAGGSLGGAVAKAFARAGARVFLTGHRIGSVQKVADEIVASGGKAEAAVVDGYDEGGVAAHLEEVRRRAGSVDISYNGVDVPLVTAYGGYCQYGRFSSVRSGGVDHWGDGR
jgi:3-oxoacyl-[acyl-carrier protein] reductase